jgi:hypothetical protein
MIIGNRWEDPQFPNAWHLAQRVCVCSECVRCVCVRLDYQLAHAEYALGTVC